MESNIFDHKFIVIDGGHFNPLGIVRSLGEKGIKSDVIAIDSPDAIMAQSMSIVKFLLNQQKKVLNTYLIIMLMKKKNHLYLREVIV